MREGIGKYRGYCCKDGEWVYGNLIVEPGRVRIWTTHDERSSSCVEVDPETVGEFTGLRDKDGAEIYEGDLVRYDGPYASADMSAERMVSTDAAAVVFSYAYVGGWVMEKDVVSCNLGTRSRHTEVVGNVTDNPDILKGTDNAN